jgi:CubicO group peptidase (beta-lactamase class C family)
VVLIAQHGKTIYQKAYGSAQRYDYGLQRMDALLPMTTEHRFDLASLTKVFATTFGIMFLVDQQKVDLDAPLFTYLPAFRGPSKDSVTVRHLLTHSAGLYPWKPLYYHADNAQDTYAYISRLSLLHPVGKERHYSDLGFMLLGYLIEEVSGQPLDMFLTNALYKPVGLKMTAFNPPPGGPGFAATSHGNPYEYHMVADDDFGYLCDENPETFTSWRDYVLAGEVNDGNAYYAHDGLAGHAGLFSTASDLQLLLDLLLNKGTHAGQRLLSEAVVETFLTKDRFGHGLAWAMSTDVIPVDDLPDGSFGHSGFTGTYVVAVPAYGLSIILLTNRQNVGVNASGYYNSVTPLRKSITELMIEAVQ